MVERSKEEDVLPETITLKFNNKNISKDKLSINNNKLKHKELDNNMMKNFVVVNNSSLKLMLPLPRVLLFLILLNLTTMNNNVLIWKDKDKNMRENTNADNKSIKDLLRREEDSNKKELDNNKLLKANMNVLLLHHLHLEDRKTNFILPFHLPRQLNAKLTTVSLNVLHHHLLQLAEVQLVSPQDPQSESGKSGLTGPSAVVLAAMESSNVEDSAAPKIAVKEKLLKTNLATWDLVKPGQNGVNGLLALLAVEEERSPELDIVFSEPRDVKEKIMKPNLVNLDLAQNGANGLIGDNVPLAVAMESNPEKELAWEESMEINIVLERKLNLVLAIMVLALNGVTGKNGPPALSPAAMELREEKESAKEAQIVSENP